MYCLCVCLCVRECVCVSVCEGVLYIYIYNCICVQECACVCIFKSLFSNIFKSVLIYCTMDRYRVSI